MCYVCLQSGKTDFIPDPANGMHRVELHRTSTRDECGVLENYVPIDIGAALRQPRTLSPPVDYRDGKKTAPNGFGPPLHPTYLYDLREKVREFPSRKAAADNWGLHETALTAALNGECLTESLRARFADLLGYD